MSNEQPNSGEAWVEQYIRVLDDSLTGYQNEHPDWQMEVVISIMRWALEGLKYHLEDSASDITWDSPCAEMHYPVEWNWELRPKARESETVQSGEILGRINREDMRDAETATATLATILVQKLTSATLANLTHGAWFEVSNNYYVPVFPLEATERLKSIKSQKKRREAYEILVSPFSIGLPSINYFDSALQAGKLSKRVAKKLERGEKLMDLEPLEITVTREGITTRLSLIFQLHPLIANYDHKEAFHPVMVGFIVHPDDKTGEVISPLVWRKEERDELWRTIFSELDALSDSLIPETESSTSVVFTVNAQLEIPLSASDPEARNSAIRKIMESLAQSGQLHDVSIKPHGDSESGNNKQKKDSTIAADKPPITASEGLLRLFWNSKMRWPIMIAAGLVTLAGFIITQLPSETKIKLLKYLGL